MYLLLPRPLGRGFNSNVFGFSQIAKNIGLKPINNYCLYPRSKERGNAKNAAA